jgi:penicillin-binding protein 1C
MKPFKYTLAVAIILPIFFLIVPPNRGRLYPSDFNSLEICDRSGKLLREVLSSEYKTSVWVPLEQISPWMVVSTIIREDRRFLFHTGVDVLALARAAIDNLRKGRVVSGGSTITMQVAKMALRLKGRSLINKILEMFYALRLELHLSKANILEIYLNRIPYGYQNYGVESATRFYFGKSASHLSLGESSALSIIPKAPSIFNPFVADRTLVNARESLLKRMRRLGLIDHLTYSIAVQEPLDLTDTKQDFEAPHFVDYILTRQHETIDGAARIITSIDLHLQRNLQKLLSTTLASMEDYNVNQGAVVVMDNHDGNILAMVGSRNYFVGNDGQVNGALAPRQPGSSIKPFLYALALQCGMRTSDILPDTTIEFPLDDGTLFAPRNYGEKYHGPTRIREALASSFNVPAVFLLTKIGVSRFYELLQKLNFHHLGKGAHHYGLALSLGAGEVSLLEIVNAYRVLANQGMLSAPFALRALYDRHGRQILLPQPSAKRIFSKEVAYLITDILCDNAARFKGFNIDNPLHLPFPCAVKTGTSKDYRDNWCIGYTTEYTVGVWVGNFSGAPMQGVSGISGAAPLFRSVMLELHRYSYPSDFEFPSNLVKHRICARSGKICGPACTNTIEETFIMGTEPRDTCDLHLGPGDKHKQKVQNSHSQGMTKQGIMILAPAHGDIYSVDPHVSANTQQIRFKVAANRGISRVIAKIDGKVLATQDLPFDYLWTPSPGNHRLEVIDCHDDSCRHSVEFAVK